LPDYYKHLKKYPKSLIARIYGIYTVKKKGYHKVNLMLMGNTLRWQNSADKYRTYDLKGSTFDRFVKTDCTSNPNTTLKDVNFLNNQRELQEINLSEKQIRLLNQQIKRDTEWLAKHSIMDYSMLMAIENRYHVSDDLGLQESASGRRQTLRSKIAESEQLRFKRHMFKSPDGTQTFHFSIIDFL
jgi:hypothetical protein